VDLAEDAEIDDSASMNIDADAADSTERWREGIQKQVLPEEGVCPLS
jgi:hypothetical protein